MLFRSITSAGTRKTNNKNQYPRNSLPDRAHAPSASCQKLALANGDRRQATSIVVSRVSASQAQIVSHVIVLCRPQPQPRSPCRVGFGGATSCVDGTRLDWAGLDTKPAVECAACSTYNKQTNKPTNKPLTVPVALTNIVVTVTHIISI